MSVLTRGERFKDARTVHNQHGKQTLRAVKDATGITESAIQALEDDDSTRVVGYDKVAALAKHYGVSLDWLCSLSDDPSRTPSAADDLGLDPCVIKEILKIKKGNLLSDRFTQEGLNIFLTESLKDGAVFYRYINHLQGVVEIEKEDTLSFFETLGFENDSNLSMDEKYRRAELIIFNSLEELMPGVTSKLSYTLGPSRIKPKVDEVCELFRDMLERMTGYKQLKEG